MKAKSRRCEEGIGNLCLLRQNAAAPNTSGVWLFRKPADYNTVTRHADAPPLRRQKTGSRWRNADLKKMQAAGSPPGWRQPQPLCAENSMKLGKLAKAWRNAASL